MMEEERFLSGYCKTLDQSRMVTVVLENGEITETDCAYPGCPHGVGCPVAEKIRDMKYEI